MWHDVSIGEDVVMVILEYTCCPVLNVVMGRGLLFTFLVRLEAIGENARA